jgi:ABC-type Fe3+/spermidine/putrescine transport system ATPase subunit
MSDFIAVMREGRIEQYGTPGELYDNPQTTFVAGFIGAQNFLRGKALGDQPILITEDATKLTAGRQHGVLPPGGPALGAVRPENVNLSTGEPVAIPNRLLARIGAVVMLGDTLEFLLHLPNGKELVSRVRRREAVALPGPGSEVWASWEPDNFTLFPTVDH